MTRGWPTRDYLQSIESVEAIDDRHVRIRTRRSSLILLSRLRWGFVLPAEDLQRTPIPVVGTGAYRLENWTPGRGFTLARNEHYWGPPPAYARARSGWRRRPPPPGGPSPVLDPRYAVSCTQQP